MDTIKITTSTKLRFFQYRIVNGYLTTNLRIAKWDKNKDSIFNMFFLYRGGKSILHFFATCHKVKTIWKALKRWLSIFAILTLNQNLILFCLIDTKIHICRYGKCNFIDKEVLYL